MTTRTKPKARKKPATRGKQPARGRGKGVIKASGVKTPDQWFVDWVNGGAPASSGEVVNEVTALGLATYFACIRNISEDEAKLPLGFVKETPSGRTPLRNHYLSYLLQGESNPEMSSFSFRQTLMVHALGWGNGYAEIVRDPLGQPIALWPLDPTACCVERDAFGEKLLFYRVHGVPMSPRSILHLHREGFSGLAGWTLPTLMKDPLGNALAAQKFAGSFFGNGTSTTGVIEVPDAMSETAFKHLRESFFERHVGSENQHKPIILEQGAKWTATSTEPQKSQMVEAMQFGIEEVCRMFRMPPHKVQHLLRATFSNIEEQSLEYVNDCLGGWLERFEQEIAIKLLFPKERQTISAKHNTNYLLRGDVAKRAAFYQVMFNIGAFSVNDIREKEDMNPVDGGDSHFVNAALVPLEMAATGEHLLAKQPAQPESTPAKPADEPPPAAAFTIDQYRIEILGHIAAEHQRNIEQVISHILSIERDNVQTASKNSGFESWVDEFYRNSHQKDVAKRLRPAIKALNTSLEAILQGAGHG